MNSTSIWTQTCAKLEPLLTKIRKQPEAFREQLQDYMNRPPAWTPKKLQRDQVKWLLEQILQRGLDIFCKPAQGFKADLALKHLRKFIGDVLSGPLGIDELQIAANLMKAFTVARAQAWFPGSRGSALASHLDHFWMVVQHELLQVYLKISNQVLQAKTRESAVLFHTTQSVNTDLDLESLLSKVVLHAGMLMQGKDIYLFITDPKPVHPEEKPRLLLRAWNRIGKSSGEFSLRFGEGPVGMAAQTKSPVLDNDYGKSRVRMPLLTDAFRVLAVPITFADELLGVLLASEQRQSERFTAAQKELFVMYAQQIGVALKNVLLYNDQAKILRELEEKNQMLESQADLILRKTAQMVVISEISQNVNSSLDFTEVLQLLTRQAAESIGVNRCLVWLFDDKKVRLEAVAAYGFPAENLEVMNMHLSDMRHSSFFKLLSSQKPTLVREGEDEVFFRETLHSLLSVKCLLAVPLVLKEETIGLLTVDDTREAHEFLDDEQNLISSIANQTVMAIENARLYLKVREQAITDGLTGVYNHRFFQLRLTDEFSHAKRYHNDLALIMLDIDYFKRYNDTYGHVAGDLALKEIAQLTKASVRENDIVARYGGEEFVIILPMTNLEGARLVAERIRTSVSNCRFLGDMNVPQVSISVSCGVAEFSREMENREDLVMVADSALYLAKQRGRNQTVLYRPDMPEHPEHP